MMIIIIPIRILMHLHSLHDPILLPLVLPRRILALPLTHIPSRHTSPHIPLRLSHLPQLHVLLRRGTTYPTLRVESIFPAPRCACIRDPLFALGAYIAMLIMSDTAHACVGFASQPVALASRIRAAA